MPKCIGRCSTRTSWNISPRFQALRASSICSVSVLSASYIFTLSLFISLTFVTSQSLTGPPFPETINPPFNDGDNGDNPDGCETCKLLVESFDKGVERTKRGKHEGGDTNWEERNLKNYADSEVRLVEIQEDLCDELTRGKAQCLALAEEAEADIEEWWVEHRNKNVRLHDYLCISRLKKCCTDGFFGPTCKKCASDCNKHGSCDGSGTRIGTGECHCQPGYRGETCELCQGGYFKVRTDIESKFTCSPCHKACKLTCDGPTTANCTECGSGYAREPTTNLCVDINECELGPLGMSIETSKLCPDGTFCINTDGHYKCSECHRACSTCVAYGRDKCITCASDHHMSAEHVCLHFEDHEAEGVEWSEIAYRAQLDMDLPLVYLYILIGHLLRRLYVVAVHGRQIHETIIRRRELVAVGGFFLIWFLHTTHLRQMIRPKHDTTNAPAARGFEDLFAGQEMHAENLADL